MRLPQRGLHSPGVLAARKDESRVARSFRKRHEPLPGVRGDLDVLHQRHGPGLADAAHFAQRTRPGNGNHHDAGSGALSFQRGDRHADRVAQDDLFE